MARETREPVRKAPGSPKGSDRGNVDVVTVEPSRCRGCGSTRRSDYYADAEYAYRGERKGQLFTHMVRPPTKCLDCG